MTFIYRPITCKHYNGIPYTKTNAIDIRKESFIGVIEIGSDSERITLKEWYGALKWIYDILKNGEQVIIKKNAKSKAPQQIGFRIRIGSEYMNVIAVSGTTWTVQRGVDSTIKAEHKVSEIEIVERARISRNMRNRTLSDYRKTLMANSPFVLRTKYNPLIASIGEITAIRGEVFKYKVAISGFDPAKGIPTFRLNDEKSIGITIDSDSGEMIWEPSKEQKTGKYPATVSVTPSDVPEDKIPQKFTIVLREPNTPPVLESIGKQMVFAGDLLAFTAKAVDEDLPINKLSFSLGTGSPEGATINAETGKFQWKR